VGNLKIEVKNAQSIDLAKTIISVIEKSMPLGEDYEQK
jgi:hypothetical protein